MNTCKFITRSIGGRRLERALSNLMPRCACIAPSCKCQPQNSNGKQIKPASIGWLDSMFQGAEDAALKAKYFGKASKLPDSAPCLSAGQSRQQQVNNVGKTSILRQYSHAQAARLAQQSHVSTSASIGFRRFSSIGEVDIREKVCHQIIKYNQSKLYQNVPSGFHRVTTRLQKLKGTLF